MSAVGGAPAPERSQLAELLDLLSRNADFRRLFLASVVSYLGDWFAFVAVSAMVKELTGSDGATAIVFAVEVLPIFLLSPLAGVLADRLDRKRMMIAVDVLRIFPALGLVVANVTGQAWLAFVCVGLISALAAFFQPVAPAVVPNVVDDEDLSIANAAMGSVWGTMLFLGAAIGGVAAATLGRNASFVLDAATFLVSALLLVRIATPFRRGEVQAAGASVLANLGEVWAFARERKVVRSLMVTKTGVGIGNGIVGLLPVFALDRFGGGDAGVGLLLAGRGLGALIGPYLGRRLIGDDGRRLLALNGLSIVAYALCYLTLPTAPSLWVAVVIVTAAHVGGGNQWVASTLGLQLTVPDAIRGRVLSLDFGLATLAMGMSALAAAALAELTSIGVATACLALIALVYGAGWLVLTRDLWTGDDDPLTGATATVRLPTRKHPPS